ncbi:MAG: thioredoxin family protein [Aureibaculum sp.]|nr:thioredoxin family protein [Aureibaculum sp.]
MKKSKSFLLLIVIATIYAFTSVDSYEIETSNGYKIGDVATDFKLKNIDDTFVSLSDFPKAKGFIIIFTCNTCPVSKRNEARILALDKKYKGLGYPVIAINPNNPAVQPGDSFELMKVRSKEKGYTFPYLFDDGQKIYPQYGASATPHAYVLQKEKEGLIVKYIGGIDDSSRNESGVKTKFVENAVDALLDGKPIEVTKTRAIGCSIKV